MITEYGTLGETDRPKSLTEVVTARLRREIVEGEFEFGQALSESKIAARYEVSRTPVREAFACLGHEGLVRTEPQHGTFVFTMDRAQFAQITEARSILETAALRLAMERGYDELIREWTWLVQAMAAALRDTDAKRYCRCDGDFHQALFSLAANPYPVPRRSQTGVLGEDRRGQKSAWRRARTHGEILQRARGVAGSRGTERGRVGHALARTTHPLQG
jgi:DNA-binding GntR family transcriptional regulator